MRILVLSMGLSAAVAILAGCETTLHSAPRVNAGFLRAAHAGNGEAPTLEIGRNVFLNRCISCHALPDVARYDSARIPRFVGWMSGRAHLTPEQKEALIKYLMAVKSQ